MHFFLFFAALAFGTVCFFCCQTCPLCGASGVPPFGSIPLVALRTPAGMGFRPPLQCLPCFFMLPVGIGAQKSLGNPIKCMALQKKKLADTSAAGAGGAGESPFRRECAARPEEWSRKAEPRKYHTRGMSCSKEVLAEKSQAPQKKRRNSP